MSNDVFISHADLDSDQAIFVYDVLTNSGLKCWMDKKDLKGGTFYPDIIGKAIRDSKTFVLIHSSNTDDRINVMNEVRMAVQLGKPIFPFKIEAAPYSDGLNIMIGTIQWIPAFPLSFVEYIPNLIVALNHYLKGQNLTPILEDKNKSGIEYSTKDGIRTTTDTSKLPVCLAFLSNTIPTALDRCAYGEFSITLLNTGSMSWNTEKFYLLGMGDAVKFCNTKFMLKYAVAPGNQATFTLKYNAPPFPGSYNLRFALHHKQYGNFEPSLSRTIIVI